MRSKSRIPLLVSILFACNPSFATYIPTKVTSNNNSVTLPLVKLKLSNSKLSLGSSGQAILNLNGDVSTLNSFVDNTLIRADGTAKNIQSSGIVVDDLNNISGLNNLNLSGRLRTASFTLPNSPTLGYVLKCDSLGNASWSSLFDFPTYIDLMQDAITNQEDSLFMGNRSGVNSLGASVYSTGVGIQALESNFSLGFHNSAFGYQSLKSNTGAGNSAFGYQSLLANNLVNQGTAFGYQSLKASTTGSQNLAMGSSAASILTASDYNLALGNKALWVGSGDHYNTAIGESAIGFGSNNGSESLAVGYAALNRNAANYNTGVGSNSLNSTTTGVRNSSFGISSLYANSSGSENLAWGVYSGYGSLTYSQRMNFGVYSGYNSGLGSAGIGYQSVYNSTGSYLTGLGYCSIRQSSASSITGFGASSLSNNSTGVLNTALGLGALMYLTSTSSNTAIGEYALYPSGSTGSTAIGIEASRNNTGTGNLSSGTWAAYANTIASFNTSLGAYSSASRLGGQHNTTIGVYSMYRSTTSNYNTVIGREALFMGNTSAYGMTYNTAVGEGSAYYLGHNSPGWADWNSLLGYESGYSIGRSTNNAFYNTLIGSQAMSNIFGLAYSIGIGVNTNAIQGNSELNIGNLLYGTLNTKTIGIGKQLPESALDVNGALVSTGLKLSSGAGSGLVLLGGALGAGQWTNPVIAFDQDWNEGGTFLYPYDATYRDKTLVIGSTALTTGNSILAQTGAAILNEQGNLSNMRVESLLDSNLVYVKASGDKVGIGTNAPNSKLHINGSLSLPVVSTSLTSYTAAMNDHTIVANCSTNNVRVNLPTASGIPGRIYVIKKIDSSINTVTVDPYSTQTVDGLATQIITSQYEKLILQSTGSSWIVI